MAPAWLRSPLTIFAVGALVVALSVLVLMAVDAASEEERLAGESPTPSAELTTADASPAPTYERRKVPRGGGVAAVIAEGAKGLEPVVVVTLAPNLTQHTVIWKQDGESRSQLLTPQDNGEATGLLALNTVVWHAIRGTAPDGRRELGIVYDASAFGSLSPTARLALLRLEGDQWRIIWDSDETDEWRGSHGDVQFPNGDLSELVVRSDSSGGGYDELSPVLHESNSGPHRYFVDTWVRDGDTYRRTQAETVPAPYATLVEFMYALSIGDEFTARDWVTERDLLAAARDLGLDDGPTKHWLITCHNGIDCGKEEPITFDPRSEHGEPRAAIFFEELDGQWLISDIKPDEGS